MSAIKDHATELITNECEMLVRGRRVQGFAYPLIIRETDARGIKQRVKERLKASGRYGNIQLWWFAFTVLLELVLLAIREWNKNKNIDNQGCA